MAHENEEQLLQFLTDFNSYQNLKIIGSGLSVSALVYRAQCKPLNLKSVAIKAIDPDKCNGELDIVQRKAEIMSLLSHPNILRPHCFLYNGRLLCVVMPFMSGGSLQSIISASFPNGLPESCIAVVLKETLHALSSLHAQGRFHRDIKASNILLDSDGSVRLADYGISESIYKPKLNHGSSSSSSSLRTNDVAGIPYWMAPEVINSQNEYTFKADIWSFGITALKLAYGLRDLPLPYHNEKNKKDKNFTKAFQAMVNSCLSQDPSKRPTAKDLLKYSFFKNCGDSEFLVENVLEGLPSVEERFKTIEQSMKTVKSSKVREEEDGEGLWDRKEQIRKRKRIEGCKFNVERFDLDPVLLGETEDLRSDRETIITFGGGLAKPRPVRQVVKGKETEVGAQSIDASEGIAQFAEEEETTQVGGIEAIEVADREFLAEGLELLQKILEEQMEKVMIAQSGQTGELADMGGLEFTVAYANAVLLERRLNMLDDQRQKVITAIGVLRGKIVLQEDANMEELMLEVIVLLQAEAEREKQQNVRLDRMAEFLGRLDRPAEFLYSKKRGRGSKNA